MHPSSLSRKTTLFMLLSSCLASSARGHVYIFEFHRVGAAPTYEGRGWVGECYLNLPEKWATDLLRAETYVAKLTPDFTFRTDWIDFPAGPTPDMPDTSFATMRDFLDDYVYDVSDPAKLDEPFGSFLLRFRGLLKVTLQEDFAFADDPGIGLPIWVEIGCHGFDGYRVKVGETIYRLPIVNPVNGFFHENCIIDAAGLFPIEVTYFNRHDPTNAHQQGRAGVELYSWHGGLPWPTGKRLVHAIYGASTIMPPRVIFQPEDILPLQLGDFDADGNIDLQDVQWLQNCWSGDGEEGGATLEIGCHWLDFDKDADVDPDDFSAFRVHLMGP